MFDWLWRRLRRKPPRTIRTFDDVIAAIEAGEIKPVVYRQGDVQIADPFAGTGLSPLERKKVILRTSGYPAGIRRYVHRHCASAYQEHLPASGQTTFAPHTEEWLPTDLIGRFRDVTHCDQCGQEFLPTDEGYIAYWVVSQADLRLLEEVLREPTSAKPAGPNAAPEH
jgi:hypothetical protein